MMELKPNKRYRVTLGTGYLDISVSPDPDYPGLDVVFVSNNKNDSEESVSIPRVLFEQPIYENKYEPVRALVWDDPQSEDYTKEITFET